MSFKKIWNFIWHEDSVWSWIVNIILAFILVKFIIYPGIGLAMGTSYPIVAVVSGSMEHNEDFDAWWENSGKWYEEKGFVKERFTEFPFKNGFNKGDIMLLKGVKPKDINIGDVVVYQTENYKNPIIHRVVAIGNQSENFITKGDNNFVEDPAKVKAKQIEKTGKAVARIPWLGWVKIIFTEVFN